MHKIWGKWYYFGSVYVFLLTFSCIILKNVQTYFKNLVVLTLQDFSSIFDYFSTLCMKELKDWIPEWGNIHTGILPILTCAMHIPDLKKYQYLGPCQTSIFCIITQTYTKIKIYNHQTPKYSNGIWEWKENWYNKIFEI